MLKIEYFESVLADWQYVGHGLRVRRLRLHCKATLSKRDCIATLCLQRTPHFDLQSKNCSFSAFKLCENVPPLVPSPLSNTDVQRAEGTGGTLILPPVSLPFLMAVTHLIYYKLNLSENEVLNRTNFAKKLANRKNILYLCTWKMESWITREKHHEKPANNTIINYFRSTKYLWKKNP